MDEYERIANLLESGKISLAEAETLIGALDEGPHSEETAQYAAPGGLRVRLRRADVEIVCAEDASEPQLDEGSSKELKLSRGEEGWLLRDSHESSGLAALLQILKSAPRRKALLRVPKGTDVRIELGQGKLTTRGLLGTLRAELGQGEARLQSLAEVYLELGQGSVEVAESEAARIEVGQGSVRARLRIKNGRHRVESGMGAISVEVLPHSDVRIDAHSGMGKVRVLGASSTGAETSPAGLRVGEGKGLLTLESGMGDIEVKLT